MKIGILTFHRATNYGAILQAYALVSYLKSLGNDVVIIDYKPANMGRLYASFKVHGIIKKIKRILLNLLMLPSLKERKKKRDMYWQYINKVLPLSNIVYCDDDLPVFDAIFVGSDQVWSTCFTDGIDKFYWGQFNRKGAKLISYAGSAAEDMSNSFTTNNNASLLRNFDAISVREDELKKYLEQKLPEKKISKVLDPTLMAGVSFFEKLIINVKPLNRPYIFIYQVIRNKNKEIQDYAKQLAVKKGCDIVEIVNSRLHVYHNGILTISDELINPTEFVSLYKYADYVITTSFHGTAFSLLFNRPFSVVSVSPVVDSRAKDLLEQLGIGDRMIELPQALDDKELDWQQINTNLEIYRKPSRNFINESLK